MLPLVAILLLGVEVMMAPEVSRRPADQQTSNPVHAHLGSKQASQHEGAQGEEEPGEEGGGGRGGGGGGWG